MFDKALGVGMTFTRDTREKRAFKKVFIINDYVRKGVVLERMQIATISNVSKVGLKLGTFIEGIVEEDGNGMLSIDVFRELDLPPFEMLSRTVFNVPVYLSRFNNGSYVLRNEELGGIIDLKSEYTESERGYYVIPVRFNGAETPTAAAGFYVDFNEKARNILLQGILVGKFSNAGWHRYYIFVKGCTSYTDLAASFAKDPHFQSGSFVDFECQEDTYEMRLNYKNMTVDAATVRLSTAHPDHLSVVKYDDDKFQLVMHDVTTSAEVRENIYEDDWLGEYGDFSAVLQPSTRYDWIKLDKVTSTQNMIAWTVADAKPKEGDMEKLEQMVKCLLEDEEINREMQIQTPWAFDVFSNIDRL